MAEDGKMGRVMKKMVDEATTEVADALARCRVAGLDPRFVTLRAVALEEAWRRTERAPASMRAAVDAVLRLLASTGPVREDMLEDLMVVVATDVGEAPELAAIAAHARHDDFLTVRDQGDADHPVQHLVMIAGLEGSALRYDSVVEATPGTGVEPFGEPLGQALRLVATTHPRVVHRTADDAVETALRVGRHAGCPAPRWRYEVRGAADGESDR